jgi:hypothetical protein
VSLCGIPLLLISGLGHYHEPWTELAPIWKDENLTKELEAALSAAMEAGEVLRKGFGWQHSVRYRGEVDLVTEVDEQAALRPRRRCEADEGFEAAGPQRKANIMGPELRRSGDTT